jgi:hypothetical protein
VTAKYRQPGYQDNDRRDDRDRPQRSGQQQPPPKARDLTYGPRPLQMAGSKTVARCAMCGTILQMLNEPLGKCAKCGAELHSCRQCNNFDPGARFECAQPIPANIPDKTDKNDCTFFALRMKLEKETTLRGAPTGPVNDARAAFDRLFKK